ncbi:glycosyltransferase [Bowmanella dokdonensis]|uniref:Glycosyltransferase n=1 Tax=Bowmanella dokdonensis TaxID=751969 RepID=A0A939DM31_9ALTE|nr:glycosyltransferase [Bowmanella dokdonensis]MBN7825084.1 glycosyltransferase [Bowmanella dokdonensis]
MNRRVLHVFGIMNRGGAELRTLDLMRKMQPMGYEFHFCVLSGQAGVLDEPIRAMGGRVHYCPLNRTFPWRFVRLLKSEQIHILHSHVALPSGLMVLLGRLAGVRLRIAHLRSSGQGSNDGLGRRLRDWILRLSLACNSNKILGVCPGALQHVWPDWQDNAKCQVVFNGLEQRNVSLGDDFWQPLFERTGPVVINLARMDDVKNHLRQVDVFAEFCRLHATASMVFVGKENPQIKEAMLDRARHLECLESLFFAGEQADPLPYLAHADVMLFPSKWEGLPGAVLEAASVGTPVLASHLPGTEDIAAQLPAVQLLDLSQDNRVWAQKLAALLTTSTQRASHQASFGRSHFLLSRTVAQLHAIYSS